MKKLTEDVYFGGITTAEDLAAAGIKTVVYLGSAHMDYEVVDCGISNDGANPPERFIEIIKRIDEAIKSGRKPVYLFYRMHSRKPLSLR